MTNGKEKGGTVLQVSETVPVIAPTWKRLKLIKAAPVGKYCSCLLVQFFVYWIKKVVKAKTLYTPHTLIMFSELPHYSGCQKY